MRISGLIGLFFFISSCLPKFSCDEWAKNFRDDQKFDLVLVKKHNSESRDAYFYGTDTKTKQNTEYYDGSGWIARNFDKFMIGDTLRKDIGKYTIIIKRKNSTILIPFECGDKIYKDNDK